MKRLYAIAALAIGLFFCVAMVQAQTVYQTRGASGPVFSDKPQPGAKAVELKPLNVIEVVPGNPAGGAARASRTDATGPSYRSFAIVFPESDGSVVANDAIFEVRVAVEPALQLGEGHAIAVSVNGKAVGKRFTATEFMIPPDFWGDDLPPPNQRMQLSAAIVDRGGAVIKQATPVQFYLRHASLDSPTRKKKGG